MKYTCKVIKGKGRGKKVGFPTFNLEIPANFSEKNGIYACWTWIKRKKYMGALHFGPIPTFNDKDKSLEVYILDYKDSRKFSAIQFELVKYLRPIKSYSTVSALNNQIAKDVSLVRKLLR